MERKTGFVSPLARGLARESRARLSDQTRPVGGAFRFRARSRRCRSGPVAALVDEDTLTETARTAVEEYAKPGQVIGVGGGGGILNRIVDQIDVRYNAGALVDITLVAGTEDLARRMAECDLPVGSLSQNPVIDVAFLGADIVDDDLNYIMSSRCDLLRERMILEAADTKILVVEESSLQGIIPDLTSIPIDLAPPLVGAPNDGDEGFGMRHLLRQVCRLPNMPPATTAAITLGTRGDLLLGDGLLRPEFVASEMSRLPGLQAHGLVSGLVSSALVAGTDSCVFEKSDAIFSLPRDVTRLSDDEVATMMASLRKWQRTRSGSAIERRFKFDGFQRAFAFVENLAALAVKMDHFPEMNVVHCFVSVTLTTHRAGGLSRRDFVMAHLVERNCDGVRECHFDD